MNSFPSFKEYFYTDFAASLPAQGQRASGQAPVVFSDKKYHGKTIQQFLASSDFERCQKEYSDLLDGIVKFVRNNSSKIVPELTPEEIASINGAFEKLKNHLSDLDSDFFGPHKNILYGAGKEYFHELEQLLNSEWSPIEKRIDAIQAMAPHMVFCSGGVLTAVEDAISTLKHQGTTGMAYRTKIQIVESHIIQYVKASHKYKIGNEVHYVNAYFNYLAEEFGVHPRLDEFVSIALPVISLEQLEACKTEVKKGLTPTDVATAMADDFLGQIKGAVAKMNIPVSEPLEDEVLTKVFHTTRAIKKATLDSAFGSVPEDTYLFEAQGTYQYRLAEHSTLIAKHFVEVMKNGGLVDHDHAVRVTKSDDESGSIMQLGNLFWFDKDDIRSDLKARDLLNVSPQSIMQNMIDDNIQPGGRQGQSVLKEISQKILNSIEEENISDVPESWLAEFIGHYRGQEFSNHAWVVPVMLLAATFNRETVLQGLVDGGASLDIADSNGVTALMCAAKRGHRGALSVLIDNGADLNARDKTGSTATMYAAKNGHVDAAKALVAKGADINAKDAAGFTAAMLAAKNGHAETLQALIDAPAWIDSRTPEGTTALMLAATNGHVDAVKALIAARVDVKAIDKRGFTAAMYAAQNRHTEVLKELNAERKRVDSRPHDFSIALLDAVEKKNTDELKAFIDKAAARHSAFHNAPFHGAMNKIRRSDAYKYFFSN
jgi:ankyrin repeat protein